MGNLLLLVISENVSLPHQLLDNLAIFCFDKSIDFDFLGAICLCVKRVVTFF